MACFRNYLILQSSKVAMVFLMFDYYNLRVGTISYA
jgi:hypothetical protein